MTKPSELTARYERMRQAAGDHTMYERALIIHQGVPGWLRWVHRTSENRVCFVSPSDERSSLSFQWCVTSSLPQRPELVCILASVVLHCMGGVA